MLASSNLITWTNIGTRTTKPLFGTAAHHGQLLTAGGNGVILRCLIVPDLTLVSFVSYNRTTNANYFLFSGKPDQTFLLERTPDWDTWLTSAEPEVTDDSGTLFYSEYDPIEVSEEFYRALIE